MDVKRGNVTYVGMTGNNLDDIKRKLKSDRGLSDYGISKCKFILRDSNKEWL